MRGIVVFNGIMLTVAVLAGWMVEGWRGAGGALVGFAVMGLLILLFVQYSYFKTVTWAQLRSDTAWVLGIRRERKIEREIR